MKSSKCVKRIGSIISLRIVVTSSCSFESFVLSSFIAAHTFDEIVRVIITAGQIDVVELQLQLTAPMRACQTALLDLINACIKELKRGNRLVCARHLSQKYRLLAVFSAFVTVAVVDYFFHLFNNVVNNNLYYNNRTVWLIVCVTSAKRDCGS